MSDCASALTKFSMSISTSLAARAREVSAAAAATRRAVAMVAAGLGCGLPLAPAVHGLVRAATLPRSVAAAQRCAPAGRGLLSRVWCAAARLCGPLRLPLELSGRNPVDARNPG